MSFFPQCGSLDKNDTPPQIGSNAYLKSKWWPYLGSFRRWTLLEKLYQWTMTLMFQRPSYSKYALSALCLRFKM